MKAVIYEAGNENQRRYILKDIKQKMIKSQKIANVYLGSLHEFNLCGQKFGCLCCNSLRCSCKFDLQVFLS